MFTVVNPVTQIADTAVNRASANGVAWPEAAAAGSINNVVVMVIRTTKMRMVMVAACPPNSACSLEKTPRIPGGVEYGVVLATEFTPR